MLQAKEILLKLNKLNYLIKSKIITKLIFMNSQFLNFGIGKNTQIFKIHYLLILLEYNKLKTNSLSWKILTSLKSSSHHLEDQFKQLFIFSKNILKEILATA